MLPFGPRDAGRLMWLVIGLGWMCLALWNVAESPRWGLAAFQFGLGVAFIVQYLRARHRAESAAA